MTKHRELQRSADRLEELRNHLERISKATRPVLEVTHEPMSQPDVLDIVALPSSQGAYGALLGGSIGLLLGHLFDEPEFGTNLGLAIGAVAGAMYGVEQVERGFRVRPRSCS